MNNLNPLYILENNQTITNPKRSARQFGRRYSKSNGKLNDVENGVKHVYRTVVDEDGNTKVKRIKKVIKKDDTEN